MTATRRRRLGNRGEEIAARFLRTHDIRVIEKQKRTPHGEIDLVCKRNETWIFVEVKTRRTETFGPPETAITPQKFDRMKRCAIAYLREHCLEHDRWRIDVVAIRLETAQGPEITHFKAVDTPYGH